MFILTGEEKMNIYKIKMVKINRVKMDMYNIIKVNLNAF